MKRLLLFVLIALAGCTSQVNPTRTAIVGARLGTIESSIVIVEGATIIAAGTQAAVPLPKDALIIDGTNKVIEGIGKIEAGQPATFTLKDSTSIKTMKDGQWQ